MTLLSLFPAYRSLKQDFARCLDLKADAEAALTEVSDRRIELEDELRELRAKYSGALEELAESRRKEVIAVQTTADWIAQFTFGRRVYSQAPELPQETPATDMVAPSRPQARQQVDELTRQFEEMYEASGIR